jgi:hypothetical protein
MVHKVPIPPRVAFGRPYRGRARQPWRSYTKNHSNNFSLYHQRDPDVELIYRDEKPPPCDRHTPVFSFHSFGHWSQGSLFRLREIFIFTNILDRSYGRGGVRGRIWRLDGPRLISIVPAVQLRSRMENQIELNIYAG